MLLDVLVAAFASAGDGEREVTASKRSGTCKKVRTLHSNKDSFQQLRLPASSQGGIGTALVKTTLNYSAAYRHSMAHVLHCVILRAISVH